MIDNIHMCLNVSRIIAIQPNNSPFSKICLTISSGLTFFQHKALGVMFQIQAQYLKISNFSHRNFIFHSEKTPANIIRDNRFISLKNSDNYQIILKIFTEELLPNPYETDCYHYNNNIDKNK